MGKAITGTIWMYMKRGFVYEILGLLLGFLTGIFIAGLTSQGTAVAVIGFILLVPTLLVVIGWLVTFVTHKIQ